MDKIGQRIRQKRAEAGLTQQELAKKAGISRNALAMYEVDKQKPRNVAIKAMASALSVDSRWLEAGSCNMRKLTVISCLKHGEPSLTFDLNMIESMEVEPTDCLAYYKISGVSMTPTISSGDIVLIHKTKKITDGRVYALYNNNDEVIIRRIFIHPVIGVILESDCNLSSGEYFENEKVVNIIGMVFFRIRTL